MSLLRLLWAPELNIFEAYIWKSLYGFNLIVIGDIFLFWKIYLERNDQMTVIQNYDQAEF